MPENPYSSTLARWAVVALGVIGVIGSGILAVGTLVKGSTSGCFARICISNRTWNVTHDPARFWFFALFWSVAAILMGRMAWKAWQDG